ncbi:Uncharacterised protein [Serratia fonticola]|uniref:hypothetical protein n=1 Tax=Serratia fonticola TaxID=47917 RepID=UPI002179352A|nr:hypothetical protein [Serratia fonticola]CAI0697397.1 Uncharacterised protein [Serratia fonticola]
MNKQDKTVDLISSLVGKKLGIAGHEARRLAITGTLAGVTQAFYSRQQSPSEPERSGG